MTRIHLKPLVAIISLGFLLTSCASSITLNSEERTKAYAEYVETQKLESMVRITSFRFNGFNSLSDKNVIITTGVNRPYLITLRDRCINLRNANVIKVHNTGSSLQARFDSISVPENMGMATKCYIKEIHKLTVAQKKAILKIGKKTEEEA